MRHFPRSGLALLLGAPVVTAQFFAPPVAWPMANPFGLVAQDLNHDGHVDLVTTDLQNARILVRLADGAGGFARPTALAVGARPHAVAARDLDGDGVLDLVTGNGDAAVVSVLLGHGDGTFAAAQGFATDPGPDSVAIGELTGDGIPDIAAASFTSQSVSVLIGDGTGRFPTALRYALPARPDHVAIADCNGDGRQDLMVSQRALNAVGVLLGLGGGRFAPVRLVAVDAGSPVRTLPVDFDGDGHLDLIVSSYKSAGAVSVLRGDGAGGFAPHASVPAGVFTFALAVADLDHDGRLDVVAGNGLLDFGGYHVLRGLPGGRLAPPVSSAVPGGSVELVLADCNRDGRLDLVISSYAAGAVHVLNGQL